MKLQRKATSNPANGSRVDEIYRAAAKIILRKGFDATSVHDIASALGITKAGLYHYVSGKKDLLFDIMSFAMENLEKHVITPARGIPDPEARLRFIIANHARLVTQGEGAVTILMDEMRALTPVHHRRITHRKRAYFDLVRETLEQLKREGKLKPVNTTVAAFSVLGMISWMSRWFRPRGTLEEEQVAKELVKMATGGVLRAAARAAPHGMHTV